MVLNKNFTLCYGLTLKRLEMTFKKMKIDLKNNSTNVQYVTPQINVR